MYPGRKKDNTKMHNVSTVTKDHAHFVAINNSSTLAWHVDGTKLQALIALALGNKLTRLGVDVTSARKYRSTK